MTSENSPAPNSVPEHVHAVVVRVERLVETRFWTPAYHGAVGVLDELDGIRVDSAHVRWLAAVAADSLGRLAEAVVYIVRAGTLDPAQPRIAASEKITSEKIVQDSVVGLIDTVGPDDTEGAGGARRCSQPLSIGTPRSPADQRQGRRDARPVPDGDRNPKGSGMTTPQEPSRRCTGEAGAPG
jgi:hypothetical protein